MKYTLDDFKRLQENIIYAFKVAGCRRRVFGTPEAITVVTGYSLWTGCDAIKIHGWHRKYGSWHPSDYYRIIPICEIRQIEKIEEL